MRMKTRRKVTLWGAFQFNYWSLRFIFIMHTLNWSAIGLQLRGEQKDILIKDLKKEDK